MAFLDGIGKKISVTSQSMVQKAKDVADITGLKSQISEEEKKLISIARIWVTCIMI